MSTGVMITLIICATIIILFGTVMIAAAVLSKRKKQDEPHLPDPAQYRSEHKRTYRGDE